jgi:hypothetical protein
MATNRDLLREAIADAKAVKETAIANAKAALTESFTPFLKEKLSQKISEMEEGDMDEDANENMHADDNNDGLDEISLDELLAELEESPEETKMEEELYEAKKDEKDEEMSLEDMSEDDLKSFIEDVIKDMVANKELEAGHEDMEDEEGAEEEDEPTDEEPTDEPADETTDDEPADDKEVDLEELLAEMNDGNHKENIEEEASMVYATDPEVIAAISTLLAGISGLAAVNWKEELTIAAKKGVKAVKEKVKSLLNNDKNSSKEDNTKVEEELEEAYSTVKTLQSELNEINLLNAKLLYTNKIFRSKSLTESQKIKVLTAFDKAKTKKEAQLVYETLTEGLKVSITKTSIKESLGSASKSLGIAIKKPIIENDAFARMRELAGLKK